MVCITHTFDNLNREEWLAQICKLHQHYTRTIPPCNVAFSFSSSIVVPNLEPVHLVTLACLIQSLFDSGHTAYISTSNTEISNYIMSDLNFSEYWSGNKNHVEAASSGNIFNLWRIVNSEKEFYASNIAEYLQRNYFNKKDLSALSVGLVEAFYNVFDHAKAGENAFLLLKYDSVKQKLKVAISDFGIGISESVRKYNPEVAATDIDAIQWAILDHSTVKSTSHNMGLGMGNILSMASEARIFSGNGLLILKGNLFKPFTINFSFPGTLIYLDVDLLSFDDVEVFDSFNW